MGFSNSQPFYSSNASWVIGFPRSAREKKKLLFHLHHFAAFGPVLRDDLLLVDGGDKVVMGHLHVEAAACLRHGSQFGAVGKHFRHRDFGLDHGLPCFVFHALNAAATGVEVAHDAAGEFIGNSDFHFHDGFKQRGLGLFHGFFEGDAAGGLERKFVRVHVVIAAVVEDHAEIDDRVACEEPALSSLDNAFFYGRNEVLGNGAAENVIHELKALAALHGFHLDFAVAVLAVAAALLLVATLDVSLAANGFTVRDFGSFEVDFSVVALLELGNNHLNVLLAGAGDEKFLGLLVAEEAEHGVFFHQLVDAVGELVFIVAALGLDREGDGRFGECDPGILNGIGFIAQCVTRESVFQLGHSADIACMELRDRQQVLALRNGQVRQLLRGAAGKVLQDGVIFYYAGENFEVGDAAGKRIVGGAEDVSRYRLGIADVAFGAVAIAGSFG